MVFTSLTLMLSQKLDYTSTIMKLEKSHMILLHEQELFLDDFERQGLIIRDQKDKIDQMDDHIMELRRILDLQQEAIKELMENGGRFKPDSKFRNPEGVPSGVEA